MLWRSLALAVILASGVGGLAARPAHAQEMDSCYDTRFGSMGCIVVEAFNFADPVLAENSRYVAWRAWVRNSSARTGTSCSSSALGMTRRITASSAVSRSSSSRGRTASSSLP